MNDFMKILEDDIKNTFFNLEEFAEVHNIDGKTYNIIIDEYELNEREKGRERDMTAGVYKRQLLIYVSKAEFGKLPRIGRLIQLDDAGYIIKDATEEGGVFVLTLEKNLH